LTGFTGLGAGEGTPILGTAALGDLLSEVLYRGLLPRSVVTLGPMPMVRIALLTLRRPVMLSHPGLVIVKAR
jgi:hypothetical protein